MNITTIRIDDRLIHGQIITKWIHYAQADRILVADDASAGNPMMKTILSLAIPSGIQLIVSSVKEAAKAIQEDNSGIKTLLIVRSPMAMLQLIQAGFSAADREIILGNMSYSDKKDHVQKILDYIYVDAQDKQVLEELERMVARITVKAIPEEKGKDARQLILNR